MAKSKWYSSLQHRLDALRQNEDRVLEACLARAKMEVKNLRNNGDARSKRVSRAVFLPGYSMDKNPDRNTFRYLPKLKVIMHGTHRDREWILIPCAASAFLIYRAYMNKDLTMCIVREVDDHYVYYKYVPKSDSFVEVKTDDFCVACEHINDVVERMLLGDYTYIPSAEKDVYRIYTYTSSNDHVGRNVSTSCPTVHVKNKGVSTYVVRFIDGE